MAVTITVGGTDRTAYWVRERTNFELITNGRGKASGIVFDVPVGDSFRPQDGQVVVISEDATVRYRGILLEPEEEELGDRDSNEFVRFDCSASDYNLIADRRVVAATYENTAFETIVDDIVTTYLSGEGITQTNVETGAAISKVSFNYVTVTEAFNVLSELTGKAWFIDADKDLHFKDLTADAAPFTLDGDIALAGTVKVRPDRQKYRNRQYVLAGTDVFPIVAVAEDSAEQTARAALEGTSGIYEHVTQAEDITSGEVALEYGGALIERFAEVSKVIEFDTPSAGLEAGQAGTANFPKHDVSSEACFVEEVNGYINEELDEVWYSVRAITGDPFGSWMEHFRKDERNKPPLQLDPPAPGEFNLAEIKPGVLVHDPPPGIGEWFQAAESGTLDHTPSAIGITHDLEYALTVRRDAAPNPDESIFEFWPLDANNVVATTPEQSYNYTEVDTGNNLYKDRVVINPGNTLAAYIQYGSPGKLVIFDLVAGTVRGNCDTTISTQANGGEPVWTASGYIYWPNVSDGDIHVFDVTDPDNPDEAQVFTSSLTTCESIVLNTANTYAFATGNPANLVISLDLSSPAAITEADTQVVTGDYHSLGIQDDNLLIMFERASAATVRWCAIDIGGAGALSLNTESTLALSTPIMTGSAVVAGGNRAIAFDVGAAASPVNSMEAHVFNISDPSAVTFVETFNYNHPVAGNLRNTKTDAGLAVLSWFGFNTDAQVTYATISYPDVAPITIDCPLRAGFGGTGLAAYAKGDIIYAAEVLPTDNRFNGSLSRLAIGSLDQILTVGSGLVPVWADAASGLPADCVSGEILVCSGMTPAWAPQSFIQHNNLSGLTDGDPHTQYLPADGSRPYTGTADFGGQSIDNAPWFRGYIDGLETANAADADHDITIYPGVCTDTLADNDRAITLAAELVKQIDAAFTEGTNAGGMATGTVAADTEYNVIVITKDADGTVDAMFDVDPAGANVPSGWTARRRIGSVFTDGSANVRGYTQTGDWLHYDVPVLDVDDTVGTLTTFETGILSVPAEVLANVALEVQVDDASVVEFQLRKVGSSSTVPAVRQGAADDTTLTRIAAGTTQINVDASSQVEYTINGTGSGSPAWASARVWSQGWLDDRGRNQRPADEEVEMLRFTVEELINNGSGVTRAAAHASMNLDACAFRFGSVQDRTYMMAKIPEAWVGVELHAVAVLSHASGSITGTGDDLIKLEVGYGLVNEGEAIPNLGTINNGTAPVDVDIDHEFPATQYQIENLQLATFTPAADERVLVMRITRDGTEETNDGSRLAANLHCHGVYVYPVADDAGYTVPDTVS